MSALAEILERWDSGEGKPYKGSLIDWSDYERDPSNIGCMCAQGQVLHLLVACVVLAVATAIYFVAEYLR